MNNGIDLKLDASILEPGDRVLVRMSPDIPTERLIESTRNLCERFPGIEFTFVAAEEIHIEPATSLRQLELIALAAQTATVHGWSFEKRGCECGYPRRPVGPDSLTRHTDARHVADVIYRAVAAWSDAKITREVSEQR